MRQSRKVYGALKAIKEFVKKSKGGDCLIGKEMTIADIAAGAMLGMMDMVETKFQVVQWKEKYAEMVRYWEKLEERESFRSTTPVFFDLREKVA